MPLNGGDEKSFNEQIVISLLGNVTLQYGFLKATLESNMQANVLDRLAKTWYMESAVNYWSTEVGEWNKMCSDINDSFEGMYKIINTCASNWANSCEASWTTRPWNYSPAKVVSRFEKQSPDGRRGILSISEFEVCRGSNLDTIKEDALNNLDKVRSACENSGFVDGTSEDTIIGIVDELKTTIDKRISGEKDAIYKNSGIAKQNVENAVEANRMHN